jgi:hypothetical protein
MGNKFHQRNRPSRENVPPGKSCQEKRKPAGGIAAVPAGLKSNNVGDKGCEHGRASVTTNDSRDNAFRDSSQPLPPAGGALLRANHPENDPKTASDDPALQALLAVWATLSPADRQRLASVIQCRSVISDR